jgi:hypothetical protein
MKFSIAEREKGDLLIQEMAHSNRASKGNEKRSPVSTHNVKPYQN